MTGGGPPTLSFPKKFQTFEYLPKHLLGNNINAQGSLMGALPGLDFFLRFSFWERSVSRRPGTNAHLLSI